MPLLITDHRSVWSEADNTTGWTNAADALSTEPVPIEATARIGAIVSTTTTPVFFTTTATNFANKLVYAWAFPRGAMDTTQNGGVRIYIGDGATSQSFFLAGSDRSAFQHETGPVGWQCLLLDMGSLPPFSGSVGTGPNTGSITQCGVAFKTLAKSVGGATNCFVDIIRLGDPTLNNRCMITYYSGSSASPINFSDMANADRETGSLAARGVIRELGTGLFGIQAPIRIGSASAGTDTYFKDSNVSILFENRFASSSRYYLVLLGDTTTYRTEFVLGDKIGTGTSATGQNGCTITAAAGMGMEVEAISGSVTASIYGSTFNNISRGFRFKSGSEFIGNTVNNSGTIYPSGALMYNTKINTSIESRSLYWNENIDPLGYLDGCSFVGSSSYFSNAIEFGPNSPTTMSLNNIVFTNYGAEATPSASLYNNSGKNLYINIIGELATIPTVKNATGLTTTIVAGLTSVTLTGLQPNTEVRILDNTTQTDIAGEEDVDLGSFTFSASAGTIVDIVIHNLQYEYIRINGFVVPANDTSIPIEQRFDRNYENP